jgi:hypothetical protein
MHQIRRLFTIVIIATAGLLLGIRVTDLFTRRAQREAAQDRVLSTAYGSQQANSVDEVVANADLVFEGQVVRILRRGRYVSFHPVTNKLIEAADSDVITEYLPDPEGLIPDLGPLVSPVAPPPSSIPYTIFEVRVDKVLASENGVKAGDTIQYLISAHAPVSKEGIRGCEESIVPRCFVGKNYFFILKAFPDGFYFDAGPMMMSQTALIDGKLHMLYRKPIAAKANDKEVSVKDIDDAFQRRKKSKNN